MKIFDINGKERECVKAYVDPNYPGYVTIIFDSKRNPGTQYIQWIPISDFLEHNPSLLSITKGADITPAIDIASTVSKVGKNTLQDITQNWEDDDYKGYFVWISRGAGEGQLRKVVACTNNTLTIDKPWEKPFPDKTSQYVLTSTLSNLPLGLKR